MRWLKRKRGTPKQIGRPFPVTGKAKLPKIRAAEQLKRWRLRKLQRAVKEKEALAKRMSRKSATALTWHSPSQFLDGYIDVRFDDRTFGNKVVIVPHDEWVGSWDKSRPVVYIDDDVPPKFWKSLAIHESVEKYLKERYGLDENAEGHEAAEEVERRWFARQPGLTQKDWDEYSKIVERIHRAEMKRVGGERNKTSKNMTKKAYDTGFNIAEVEYRFTTTREGKRIKIPKEYKFYAKRCRLCGKIVKDYADHLVKEHGFSSPSYVNVIANFDSVASDDGIKWYKFAERIHRAELKAGGKRKRKAVTIIYRDEFSTVPKRKKMRVAETPEFYRVARERGYEILEVV